MWKSREHAINAAMWCIVGAFVLKRQAVPPEQFYLWLPALGLAYSYATDYVDTML